MTQRARYRVWLPEQKRMIDRNAIKFPVDKRCPTVTFSIQEGKKRQRYVVERRHIMKYAKPNFDTWNDTNGRPLCENDIVRVIDPIDEKSALFVFTAVSQKENIKDGYKGHWRFSHYEGTTFFRRRPHQYPARAFDRDVVLEIIGNTFEHPQLDVRQKHVFESIISQCSDWLSLENEPNIQHFSI